MKAKALLAFALFFVLCGSAIAAGEKFDEILFWSEFPQEADWNALNSKLMQENFSINIYIASSSPEEYAIWREKINLLSNIEVKGAWPTLPLEKGYWFSGFLEKEDIDKLEEFRGLDMKIDVEAPFPGAGAKKGVWWFLKQSLKKGRNSAYLEEKIQSLVNDSNVIVSSFPFPDFMLRRHGFYSGADVANNYMFYTSFFPAWLRPFYKAYYIWIIKSKLKMNEDTYFAVGLLDKGIFGDEPTYSSEEELDKDLSFLLSHGAKKVVVYRAEALLSDKEWIKILKQYA